MKVCLTRSDDELKTKFANLQTRLDVADMLEIDYKTLIYYLYRNKDSNYKQFLIAKKTGGTRLINAPVSSLKILQKKLSKILYLVHKPKSSSHGFLVGKNIASNAQRHTNRKLVINCDLKDFFPSINFGRVRGMFMAGPYNLPAESATVLAQICCCDGKLPQGAPTSPIISNMVCARLDSQMKELAYKYRCIYTRYADDISLSTDRLPISIDLIKIFISEGKIKCAVGDVLLSTIRKNGFDVNNDKTRAQNQSMRQEVTGLVVNKKINVKKKLISQIRAMLHAWEKYGPKKAELEYDLKYNHNQRKVKNKLQFKKVVAGKISFLKLIRSDRDYVYRKFENKFNELDGKGKPTLPLNVYEEMSTSVWIIKSGSKTGTAFMLNGYGLVTCSHCIEDPKDIQVFRFNDYPPIVRNRAEVTNIDTNRDLAVLKINGQNNNFTGFNVAKSCLSIQDNITNAGFPFYKLGNSLSVSNGRVKGKLDFKGVERILVTHTLFSGESGSPALNDKNEVVGVVATGADVYTADIFAHSVIPICELISMVKPT